MRLPRQWPSRPGRGRGMLRLPGCRFRYGWMSFPRQYYQCSVVTPNVSAYRFRNQQRRQAAWLDVRHANSREEQMSTSFKVNSKQMSVNAPPDTRLLWVLREE